MWQAALGFVVSIAFLVWALWDVNFADVVRHIREANPVWLLLSAALVTATFPLRAIRWRILLASSMGRVPYRPLWHATAIGFMANNILPARAGELVRCFAATRLAGVPFTTALATVAVERVFDGVTIVLLLSLAVASPSFPTATTGAGETVRTLAMTMTVVFLGALVFLVVLARSREKMVPPIARLIRRVLPVRPANLAVRIMENVVEGLGVLQSTRDVARVIGWSFVVWLTNAASYVVAFYAFHLALPTSASFALQGVVAFGVAIPAAPGFFGVFEKLSQLVLGLYGVPDDRGASFAIGVHMGWWLPITIWGLIILARTGMSLKDLRAEPAPAAKTPA